MPRPLRGYEGVGAGHARPRYEGARVPSGGQAGQRGPAARSRCGSSQSGSWRRSCAFRVAVSQKESSGTRLSIFFHAESGPVCFNTPS